ICPNQKTQCTGTECGSNVPDGCGGTIPDCPTCEAHCDCHCGGPGCDHDVGSGDGNCVSCSTATATAQDACDSACAAIGCQKTPPTCTCPPSDPQTRP